MENRFSEVTLNLSLLFVLLYARIYKSPPRAQDRSPGTNRPNAILIFFKTHRLRTPPNRDAFKHSGGDNLLCTSPTVTLYFEVELRRESRPGTLQKTSLGVETPERPSSLPLSKCRGFIPAKPNERKKKFYY